jgi:hypothetical protein
LAGKVYEGAGNCFARLESPSEGGGDMTRGDPHFGSAIVLPLFHRGLEDPA